MTNLAGFSYRRLQIQDCDRSRLAPASRAIFNSIHSPEGEAPCR
jgi:hypothetical protein